MLQDSLKIDDNPIGDGKYYANWISSEGTVAANSEVEFIAADSIVLLPGFSAKPNFTAKIGQNEGTIRHYVNGVEYFEGEMEAIYHEVGRVFFEGVVPIYEFTIADHLGNTRTVFKDDGGSAEVLQENDYYAFGMGFEQGQNEYGYTFGHKEEQNELGLSWSDFGARVMDRSIGRFVNIDLLSESFLSNSPYSYGFNNPIFFNDPSGMAPEKPDNRPELPNPSGDLYGRGGGSHVIGQSGVLDLTDSEDDRGLYLEGSKSERSRLLANLQALTNDALDFVPESGEVFVTKSNARNAKRRLKLGTKMLRDLINENNKIILKISPINGTNPIDEFGVAVSEANYNPNIEYDVSVGVTLVPSNTLNQDGSRGGIPTFITVGHELFHAVKIASANNNRTITNLVDPDTNAMGLMKAAEFETRLFENKLRFEHRIKLRAIPYSPNVYLNNNLIESGRYLEGFYEN